MCPTATSTATSHPVTNMLVQALIPHASAAPHPVTNMLVRALIPHASAASHPVTNMLVQALIPHASAAELANSLRALVRLGQGPMLLPVGAAGSARGWPCTLYALAALLHGRGGGCYCCCCCCCCSDVALAHPHAHAPHKRLMLMSQARACKSNVCAQRGFGKRSSEPFWLHTCAPACLHMRADMCERLLCAHAARLHQGRPRAAPGTDVRARRPWPGAARPHCAGASGLVLGTPGVHTAQAMAPGAYGARARCAPPSPSLEPNTAGARHSPASPEIWLGWRTSLARCLSLHTAVAVCGCGPAGAAQHVVLGARACCAMPASLTSSLAQALRPPHAHVLAHPSHMHMCWRIHPTCICAGASIPHAHVLAHPSHMHVLAHPSHMHMCWRIHPTCICAGASIPYVCAGASIPHAYVLAHPSHMHVLAHPSHMHVLAHPSHPAVPCSLSF